MKGQCHVQPYAYHSPVLGSAASFAVRLGSFASRRVPLLDLEGLPEHLKRDLGFGAGRETPPRDLLRD